MWKMLLFASDGHGAKSWMHQMHIVIHGRRLVCHHSAFDICTMSVFELITMAMEATQWTMDKLVLTMATEATWWTMEEMIPTTAAETTWLTMKELVATMAIGCIMNNGGAGTNHSNGDYTMNNEGVGINHGNGVYMMNNGGALTSTAMETTWWIMEKLVSTMAM